MTRSALTTLGLLACLGGPLAAQPPAAPSAWANKLFLSNVEADPSQPAPGEVVHDFGTLPKGTLAVKTFTVTNIYAVPMQVTDVRRTSETVQAYPPQRLLQPNEKAEFVVTLDTARFVGAGSETVQVSFGPTNVSTATLRVKATSRADVMLSPGSFNFGAVAPGASPTKTVTVEYAGKQKDWAVTGVVAPAGPFDVTTSDAGRGKTKINVTLKANAATATGSLNDFLQLRTNDPATPVITVAINGTLRAPLEVGPSNVAFPQPVKIGETVAFNVIVKGSNVGPFKIEPLADGGDGLSVQTLNAPNPVHTITVRFTPTKAGVYAREVKLPTDLKGQPTVNLTVTATVVP